MSPNAAASCVRIVRESTTPSMLVELSGGISLDNIAGYADTGADLASTSVITQSAPALDIALDLLEQPNGPKGGGRYPAAE